MTVKVVDGNSGSDTIAVTLNVTDREEPPLAPDAPSVSATTGSNTSLDVTWTEPSNTGRPAIDNYDLRYQKTTELGWTNGPENRTGTSATIGSLDPGTDYRVQVRARNAEGAVSWSTSGPGTTSGGGRPAAPTSLTATANGQSEIELAWTAPASTGGSPITGYRIEVSSTRNSGWSTRVTNTGTTTTRYSHTGLPADTTRYYRVSAINANGPGPVSNVDGATTDAGRRRPSRRPHQPDRHRPTGRARIDLAWTAPASTGGSPITGYRIEVSSTRNSGWSTRVTNTGTTTTRYSHTDLPADTTRYYRVSAINANGPGPVSNVDGATTDAGGGSTVRAVDDAADTPEDTSVTIAVLDNDSPADRLTVVEVSVPTHGTAVVAAAGTVEYTPGAGLSRHRPLHVRGGGRVGADGPGSGRGDSAAGERPAVGG